MARSWGSWSATSSTGARYRVGIDYTVSGTKVTVSQYVFESAYSINKNVTLKRTGGLSGSYSVRVNTSGGVVGMGHGGSVTGKRGGSVTIGGRVTNILHGLTCSVSVRVDIPALAPSTPGAPTVSNVTSSSARLTWNEPNNNGAAIDQYGYRAERGGTFIDGGFTTSRSATVYGLQPNTRYGARVRARNSVGWSSFSSFRYFTTSIVRPNSPTNLSATRVNDERVTLSWTRHDTSGGPYARQRIRRRVNGGAWHNLASVSAGATSYTDDTTSYANRYEYAVRAENSAGNSSFTYSNQVYMRPRGPVGTITAQKTSNNNILVSWPASSSDYTTGYKIYESSNGGPETHIGSTSSTSWTHLDPDPSVTHAYRISSTYGSLEGNKSEWSNTVQLQAPPLAPTLISPEDGAVLPRTESLDLIWQHNPVDTTDQTEYEVAYRVGEDEPVIFSGTTEQSHTVAASGLSGSIRWNARTRGADPNWSPWAPANTFLLASVPSVVIQEPSTDTLAAAHVAVEWSYADDDGYAQATWQAELLDDEGQLLEQASGHGAATFSHAFEARLSDATEYTIRVRARSGAGLWSDWDEVYFTTDFPLPATIEPSLEWDRATGAVSVTLATEPLHDNLYAWTGDPDASPSTWTRDGEVVATNLIPNSRGRDTSGTVVVRENLYNPANLAGWSVTTTGTILQGSYDGYAFPVTPGEVYSFRRTLPLSSRFRFGFTDVTPADGVQTFDGSWDGAHDTDEVVNGVVVPANATHMVLYLSNTQTGDVPLLIEKVSVAGEYFDGDASPDPDLTPVWTGTAGASTSQLTAPKPVGWDAALGSVVYYSASHDAVAAYRPDSEGVNLAWYSMDIAEGDTGTLVMEAMTPQAGEVFVQSLVGAVDPVAYQASPGEWATQRAGWGPTTGDLTGAMQIYSQDVTTLYVRAASIDGTDSYTGPWFDGHKADAAAPDAVDVERKDQDGDWVLIGSGLDPETSITDNTPRLFGEIAYRVISRTTLPSESVGPEVTIEWRPRRDDPSVFVNGGDGLSVVCTGDGGGLNTQPSVEQTSVRFAGQSTPTAIFGVGTELELTWSGAIHHGISTTSTREQWIELLQRFSIVCFRDIIGRKTFGIMALAFSQRRSIETIELTITQVRYVEGVDRVPTAELVPEEA